RLKAFGDALVELMESHGALLLAAESGVPDAFLSSAPRAVYRAHVAMLLREADPALDADYLADVLLAALGTPLFLHQRARRGMDPDRIRTGFAVLVDRLLGSGA